MILKGLKGRWEVDMWRAMITALLLSAIALGQSSAAAPAASPVPQTAAPGSTDGAAQMRLDLNQMESLLNNMSSEVTFLRDQNLQILLNTNVRMWSMLIRDLRLQLDEQERKSGAAHAISPK